MNYLMILTAIVFIGMIFLALLMTRSMNMKRDALAEQAERENKTVTEVIRQFHGEPDSSLSRFIFENDQTLFRLNITLDAYESLEFLDWINSGDAEPVYWFRIDQENGGTELGFFHNDRGIHLNASDKRAVKISGQFRVESVQGPKDEWMTVTVRSVQ